MTKPKRKAKPAAPVEAAPAAPRGAENYDALFGREWKRVWHIREHGAKSQEERIIEKCGSATVIREASTGRVIWWRKDVKGADKLVAALERINGLTSEWLRFSPGVMAFGGKTYRFSVHAKQGDQLLGTVRWHGEWRGYAFIPEGWTYFEPTCLRDLASFIEAHNEEHRARLRTAYAFGKSKAA